MNRNIFLNIFYCCMLFAACTNTITGGSTETSTKVAGILHNPGGSPAIHAKVQIYPINFNPNVSKLHKSEASEVYMDSAITDGKGNYSIIIDPGTYTILSSGDSGLSFRDSVIVLKGKVTRLNSDTLTAPGSIKGTVQLQPGDDARTVFISFMGTNVFISPSDSNGNFLTVKMAGGKYRVRIQTTLDNYAVMDTSLSVVAGTDTILHSPILLKYEGIPVPMGVKMNYDTARQIATILWNKSDANLVKGYNVFRRDIDSSGFEPIPMNGTNLIKDTTLIDSTGLQNKSYEYKITAVDMNDNSGKFSNGIIVTFSSFFKVVNTFGTFGTGTGQFRNPSDMAISSNGDVIIVDKGNKRVQVFDRNMQFKREFSTNDLVPERIAIDDSENAFVSVILESSIRCGILKVNPTGTIIDTFIIGKGVFDLSVFNNEIWAITSTHIMGDSISIFSLDGTPIRAWPGLTALSMSVEDSNRIWITSYEGNINRAYDASGDIIDSLVLGERPLQIAFNPVNKQMVINCSTSKTTFLGDTYVLGSLLAYDGSRKNVARYTLQGTISGSIFFGIQTDGMIYELLQAENKIIQLAPLHQ